MFYNYDEMSVSQFYKSMFRRLDGIATIVVAALFLATAIAAAFGMISIGRFSGLELALSALALIPILIIYYTSLVYFSSSGHISMAINVILIAAVPVLFYFLA